MKDYKLKQRNLRASHTLGWSWNWNIIYPLEQYLNIYAVDKHQV